jgi:hypothetical protein
MQAITVLPFLLWVLCCTPTAGATEDAGNTLPENWYSVAPWAQQPPVDIIRRVAAIQSALGGLQSSVNAYSSAIQAQADAHNQRVFMQAELARIEAMQPKPEPRRSNFQTRGTPEEIDAAARARMLHPTGKIPKITVGSPGLNYTEQQAYELGVTTAEMVRASRGWGNALHGYIMYDVPR